jgi:hypothetical protein
VHSQAYSRAHELTGVATSSPSASPSRLSPLSPKCPSAQDHFIKSQASSQSKLCRNPSPLSRDRASSPDLSVRRRSPACPSSPILPQAPPTVHSKISGPDRIWAESNQQSTGQPVVCRHFFIRAPPHFEVFQASPPAVQM